MATQPPTRPQMAQTPPGPPATAVLPPLPGGPAVYDEIRVLVATAQSLKDQGASEESDPDFARVMNLLRFYAKQQQLAQQHQQQVALQKQPSPSAQHQPPAPYASTSPAQPGSASQQPPFSPDQISALRYQIQAYKLLSANRPIPDQLQKIVLDPSASASASSTQVYGTLSGAQPQQTQNAASQKNQLAQSIVHAAVKQEQHSAHLANLQQQQASALTLTKPQQAVPSTPSFVSPFAFYARKVSLLEFQQRIIIPSGLPTPIDPLALKRERERMLNLRVAARIHELETLPSNIATGAAVKIEPGLPQENGTPSADGSGIASDAKIRALIELKALRLLEKQRALRAEIVGSLSHCTTLATAADRSALRKMKKPSLREARQTERQERSQRIEREKREHQKHVAFLTSILTHGRDALTFHRNQAARNSKLGMSVQRFHQNIAKEEERRLQKLSQERLNALKANDEEAYLKLIDRTKDTRITHLLEQTNSFLTSLMNAVEKQKTAVGTDFEIPVNTDMPADDDDPETTRDYYATAHRIREVITEQPSILVGGTLKEYQIKGLQWMVSLYNNRLNGILADEMGLGKTIQTLSLITYLIEKKKQPGPFLVIVPLSTITNWVIEFEKWAPSVVKIVYKGSPAERKNLASVVKAGGFNVLLTTFEYIINPKDRPVLSKVKWVHMIIDEGHRMKNSESRLSTTLVQYYTSRYRLILTGTPLQNNLPELWALLNFILPKIFNSVKSFDEWFNSPFAGSTGQERIALNEEEQLLIIRRLHKVLRPFLLRRLKKDVESELPDKVETVVKCPMSGLQKRLYENIRSRRFAAEAFSKKKALNNIVMQFRKICNHPFVFDEVEESVNPSKLTNEIIYRVAGKFELIDRILPKFKASDHRVLMFFQMTQIMDIMEDYLRWRGHTYLRLDGHTKPEERTTMLKRFNSPDDPPFIFLLSTRAGGLGLNLQTADTVIIYDSDWNPHQDLQAQDRAHRIGQKKEVRILRLITTKSVEETILARAQYKLDIDGKVIQAGKFDNKTSDREREELLRSLFGADEDDKEDEEKEDKEDKGELNDAELNEIIARNEDEIELFAKMDQERIARENQMWHSIGRPGPPPPRLMEEKELPAIFFEVPDDPEEIARANGELILGRGGRNRKEVSYDDGLNEDQWLSAIDQGDVQGFIARKREQKQRRISKQIAKQQKMQQDKTGTPSKGDNEDDNDVEDDDGDDDGTPASNSDRRGRSRADPLELPDPTPSEDTVSLADSSRGTGRRKRGRPSGRKSMLAEDSDAGRNGVVDDANEEDSEEVGRGRKRSKRSSAAGKGAGGETGRRRKLFAGVDPDEPDPLAPEMRAALRRVFMESYKAVESAEVEIGGYTRQRCELYLSLPDRVDYADYYKFITRPIAMDMILHRAIHAYYKTLGAFIEDFHLMFANAMQYNVEGSEVWLDAVEMQKIFDATIARLCPNGEVPILPQDLQAAAEAVAARTSNDVKGIADGVDGTGETNVNAGQVQMSQNYHTVDHGMVSGNAAHDDAQTQAQKPLPRIRMTLGSVLNGRSVPVGVAPAAPAPVADDDDDDMDDDDDDMDDD